MSELSSILYSTFVIDGVTKEVTPAEMLSSASGKAATEHREGRVVDESVQAPRALNDIDLSDLGACKKAVASVLKKGRQAPADYASFYTRKQIASAIINTLWLHGRYSMDDLRIRIVWKWDVESTGGAASFYESVEAACDYLDALGLILDSYSFEASEKSQISVECKIQDSDGPSLMKIMGRRRVCSSRVSGKSEDWLIYVPFDTCDFRLGGSALYEAGANVSGQAPEILDADYFMDCYELVRELVEDGVVLSAQTVGEGGLLTAMEAWQPLLGGIRADLGELLRSYGESDAAKILFSEIPGALIEIKDDDYDYVDAEFLLQDVAWYPIGHPGGRQDGLNISVQRNSAIVNILQALLDSGASEGED